MTQKVPYLLIGNGRVATHFKHYLSLLNLAYLTWDRQLSISDLHAKILLAERILILISDNAIESFLQTHLQHKAEICLHFSGALNSQHCVGAHPLMSFTHQLYTLDIYQKIPFIIDENAPDFSFLMPGLPNQHVRLKKELKTKYHALCVLSGNFSCLLWQKLFTSLQQEFNFPSDIAHSYLQQLTQNLLTHPSTALTGPLTRGDKETIDHHIAILEGDPFQGIYQSFVTAYQQLQREKNE